MDPTSKSTRMIFLTGAVGAGVLMLFGSGDRSFLPAPKTQTKPASQAEAERNASDEKTSPDTLAGKNLYNTNCLICHGINAKGTDNGPTFIHKVYHPNHHGDASFLLAVKRGVRAHHWRFGNMPALPQVSEQQVLEIVKYVRHLQKTAGVF